MTTRRFLRKVRVTIGGVADEVIPAAAVRPAAIVIEDLYIRFRIRKEVTDTPLEGVIDIYNLNESNETRIRERAERVLLEAGYEDGGLEVIFDGAVRRVERQRVDLDRVTRIHVGGKTSRAEIADHVRRKIFDRSYEGTVTVREIIEDAVETTGLFLDYASFAQIPEDAVETDRRFATTALIAMQSLLRPLGVEWYEEDGVVFFSAYRKSADDRLDGVVVSEKSGMISSPTVTDDGVRIRTLLDPRIRLDTRFRIESSILDRAASGDAINESAAELQNAVWKVIAITHAGDNRLGEYVSELQGRPLD